MSDVKTCSVSPSKIALGGQSNLTVTLDAPAPPGGVTVIIDTDFDGDQETLLNTPVSLDFDQGASTFPFLLQTQIIDNPATRIMFSAHVEFGPAKTAQLNIT